MDLEDSFASAPVRYALDDVDSDEELELSLNLDKVSVHTEITVDFSNPVTLVIGLEGPGSVYIHSIQGETAKPVGSVTYKREGEEAETKATILYVENKNTLFIAFTEEIQPEEAAQYTKSILNTVSKLDKVIVLDSFTAVGYTSEVWGDELTPPFLRVLQTHTAAVVKELTLYEAPNMIKGLSAAIVNHCEIHSIPCYDLLTLQESIYGKLLVTAEILEAYSQGLHRLGLNISFSEKILKDILTIRHSGRVDDSHHRLYL